MLTVVVLVYQLKDPVADLTGRHGDVTGRLEFDLVDDLHHTHITEALSSRQYILLLPYSSCIYSVTFSCLWRCPDRRQLSLQNLKDRIF